MMSKNVETPQRRTPYVRQAVDFRENMHKCKPLSELKTRKLAPYGTDGRLLLTANFKVA